MHQLKSFQNFPQVVGSDQPWGLIWGGGLPLEKLNGKPSTITLRKNIGIIVLSLYCLSVYCFVALLRGGLPYWSPM